MECIYKKFSLCCAVQKFNRKYWKIHSQFSTKPRQFYEFAWKFFRWRLLEQQREKGGERGRKATQNIHYIWANIVVLNSKRRRRRRRKEIPWTYWNFKKEVKFELLFMSNFSSWSGFCLSYFCSKCFWSEVVTPWFFWEDDDEIHEINWANWEALWTFPRWMH